MSLPDLWETARGIESPFFQGARELFAAKGGVFEYAAGRGAHYQPTGDPHRAGPIRVDPLLVANYVPFFGSALQVLRTTLLHEIGHFMGELQAKATMPAPTGPATAHIDWCYMHEARATLFAYKVAKELKAKGLPAYVIAPTRTMDVFGAMAEAERTGTNLLMLAKSYYAASSYSNATCRSHIPRTARGVPDIPVVRIVGNRRTGAVGARR